MTTTEERMQILRMVENGHINSEEASRLLEALAHDNAANDQVELREAPRWFRVRVTDMRTGKRKVNVNIPMGLVNVGVRMGAKFAPEMAGIDTDEILRAVKEGAQGKLIDVEDEEDGERVEIFVE